MVILLKKRKSVTNIHLNVKVINKGPSEHFFFWSEDFLISSCPFSLCHQSKSEFCVLATAAALHHHFLVVF